MTAKKKKKASKTSQIYPFVAQVKKAALECYKGDIDRILRRTESDADFQELEKALNWLDRLRGAILEESPGRLKELLK